MKRVLDNLKQNWITYGFETLVVLVGILGAFALNNWNEERKDQEREKEFLVRLTKDLTSDTTYLNRRINQCLWAIQTGADYLNQSYQKQESITEVQKLFGTIPFVTDDLILQNSTYEELKSSGNLGLIQNQSLKAQIVSHYNKTEDFTAQVLEFNRSSVEFMIEIPRIVPNFFRLTDAPRIVNNTDIRIDYLDDDWQFINDPSSPKFLVIENMIQIYRLRYFEHLNLFRDLQVESKELLEQLQTELESRQ